MDIDKIREVTRDVAEKVNREHPLVTHEGIADTISKAVAAAFEEYERQNTRNIDSHSRGAFLLRGAPSAFLYFCDGFTGFQFFPGYTEAFKLIP